MQRHYLAVAFPLTFVWLARLALPATAARPALKVGRSALLALCLAQAVLTASFLDYVHVNHGTRQGDFGTTYVASPAAAPAPTPARGRDRRPNYGGGKKPASPS